MSSPKATASKSQEKVLHPQILTPTSPAAPWPSVPVSKAHRKLPEPHLHSASHVSLMPPTGSRGSRTLHPVPGGNTETQRRKETDPQGGCQLVAEPRLASGPKTPCPGKETQPEPLPRQELFSPQDIGQLPTSACQRPRHWGLSPDNRPLHCESPGCQQLGSPY